MVGLLSKGSQTPEAPVARPCSSIVLVATRQCITPRTEV